MNMGFSFLTFFFFFATKDKCIYLFFKQGLKVTFCLYSIHISFHSTQTNMFYLARFCACYLYLGHFLCGLVKGI